LKSFALLKILGKIQRSDTKKWELASIDLDKNRKLLELVSPNSIPDAWIYLDQKLYDVTLQLEAEDSVRLQLSDIFDFAEKKLGELKRDTLSAPDPIRTVGDTASVASINDSRINVGNPSKTYSRTKLFWSSCPRCNGQDLYKGIRRVENGNRGLGRFADDADADTDPDFMFRVNLPVQSEREVWICRQCQERAVTWERPLTEPEMELVRLERSENLKKEWSDPDTWKALAFFGFIGIVIVLLLLP
jgi:hypothetical protein